MNFEAFTIELSTDINKELLQKNGLPHTGKKEELIERLVQHDETIEKELGSLEEEFGNLEDYKG